MKPKVTILFYFFLITLATIIFIFKESRPLIAAVFTVNSTVDALDANLGNGICATADNQCTLRAAIQEANVLGGSNTIILPADTYTLTIAGTGEQSANTGDLDVTNGILTVTGAGAATTIINGGSIDRVFEILISATMNISGVTIEDGNTEFGGGISNHGTLNLTDCTISGNTATIWGGGIINSGIMTLTNSTISGNRALNGGAGGIANTVSLSSDGILHFGNAVLINITITGNTAALGAGGIYNGGFPIQDEINPAIMTATNITISDNSAPDGGGILNWMATISLRNTIVANSPSGGNCSGIITSQGHNLSSDNTCNLGAMGDMNNTNPFLGPLSNNGGVTLTHALLDGSPAIDAGDNTGVPATDQRGFSRIQNGIIDIGAYELQVVNPQSPISVPILTEWGIVVMIFLFGGGAIYHQTLTHRKKAN